MGGTARSCTQVPRHTRPVTPETLVTSDLHLGHPLMAELRGFSSVDAHDAAVKANWFEVVKPTAHVHILGDVAMGRGKPGLAELASWPGVKHLYLGNHDRAHPSNRQSHNYFRELVDKFESIQLAGELRSSKGTRVLLSHFPYAGDHTDTDRFDQWRLRDLGVPLAHGHTHSNSRLSVSSRGTVQVHVGMDAWNLRPIPIAIVFGLIRASGPAVTLDE